MERRLLLKKPLFTSALVALCVLSLSGIASAKGKKGKNSDPSGDPAAKALMQLKSSAKSGNFATRAAAVGGLGLVGKKQKKEVLPILKEALKDAQWQVRRAAIGALVKLKDKSWEKPILEAMALRGLDAYNEVLPLLEPLGIKRALKLVKKAITQPKFDGPERYADAFLKKGGPWMVQAYLMGVSLKGGVGDVFRQRLAKLPLPEGSQVYKKVLAKQSPQIQAAVIQVVAADKNTKDIGFLAKMLKSKDANVAFATAVAMAHRKNTAGKALLVGALSEENTDTAKKLTALKALKPIATADLYGPIRPIIKDDKAPNELLSAALEIHAALKNPKLVGWITKQLSGTDVRRRAIAATVMGRVQGQASLATLHKLVRAGGHFDTRLGAARSIADLASPTSIAIIREVLFNEQDERMKVALLNALGRIRTPECVPVIRAELSQDNPRVKAAAVAAMGMVRHESTVPDLKMAFRDRSKEVRKNALTAIMALGPQRYLSNFKDALNWLSLDLLDGLAKTHKAAFLPHLKLALKSSKDTVRLAAFASLVHLGKKVRGQVAKELVVTSQRRPQRLAALGVAMKLLSKKEAVELASTMAKDKDNMLVVAALNALGRLGAKGARDILAKQIDAETEEVRVAASVALMQL